MLCQLSYGGWAGATRTPDETTSRLALSRDGPLIAPRPGATGSVSSTRPVGVLEVSMAKLSFLAGFGAGYVLGAKAGRERYEQIRRAWEHAKDDPRLQGVAGMAQARADAVVSSVRGKMGNDTPR